MPQFTHSPRGVAGSSPVSYGAPAASPLEIPSTPDVDVPPVTDVITDGAEATPPRQRLSIHVGTQAIRGALGNAEQPPIVDPAS